MNRFSTRRRSVRTAIAVAALGASLGASAEAYSQVQEFQSTVIAGAAGPGMDLDELSVVLNYQLFNPAWGTLVGARWSLQSALDGISAASVYSTSTDPNAQQSGTFRATSAAGVQALRGTGGIGKIIKQFFDQDSCTTSLASGPCNITLDLTGFVDGAVQADHLDEFVGIGSFDQSVFNYVLTENIPELDGFSVPYMTSSSVLYLSDPQRNGLGKLVLNYDYIAAQAVPEPSSLALLGLGLSGMAFMRRQRLG